MGLVKRSPSGGIVNVVSDILRFWATPAPAGAAEFMDPQGGPSFALEADAQNIAVANGFSLFVVAQQVPGIAGSSVVYTLRANGVPVPGAQLTIDAGDGSPAIFELAKPIILTNPITVQIDTTAVPGGNEPAIVLALVAMGSTR